MKALSVTLLWGVLALLTLTLLARNVLAIPVLAPLDPNEGWNAAHALALLAGHGLYPPPQSLMVNNYPPLSFYLVRSEEHTSELQSRFELVCRLLLEKKGRLAPQQAAGA